MPHAVAQAVEMPSFHTIVSQASRLVAAPGAFAALRRASNFLRFVLGFGSGWRSLEAETRAAAALLEGVAEPVVIDAGAHAGEWTDALLRRLGPERRVRAILAEPSPDFARGCGRSSRRPRSCRSPSVTPTARSSSTRPAPSGASTATTLPAPARSASRWSGSTRSSPASGSRASTC